MSILLRKEKTYLNAQSRLGKEVSLPKVFITDSFRTNVDILLLFVVLIGFHYAPKPGTFWRFARKSDS